MGPNTPNNAGHDAYRALAPAMPPHARHRDPRTAKAQLPADRYIDPSKPRLDTPMKIAIVNQPQDPIVAGEEQRGSVAIVNWELAKRLAEHNEVTVYAPRAPGQARTERWKNIEIRPTNSSRVGCLARCPLSSRRRSGRKRATSTPFPIV